MLIFQQEPTPAPGRVVPGYKFPYPVLIIIATWTLLALCYTIAKWRQKSKNLYIIPRVFVLCSPRTVQFHYELILRVGLPSYEFNPDKHDIDITVHGHQRNEVVPMTRLNTKTLLDEPLITSLSIIVYRLVEMPTLGYLVLRHSGPYRAWLYAYDFTVIDLSTNKEQYYTLNQYIGSLSRHYQLEDSTTNVHYPIDDVPLPQWSTDDMFLVLYSLINCVMFSMTILPINCSYIYDIASVGLATFNGSCVVFFLDWLLYYYSRWDAERREYFNTEGSRFCPNNSILKIIVAAMSTLFGAVTIYFALPITDWRETLVWALATLNTCTFVVGFWNVASQAEIGQSIVAFGLKLRGIEMESVGMKYSEMISDFGTKSGSASIDGLDSNMSLARGLGPRSSVKSFGFDPLTGHPSRRVASRTPYSRLSHASSLHGGGHYSRLLTASSQSAPSPSIKQHGHHQEAPSAPTHPPEEKSSSSKRKHKKEESLKQHQQVAAQPPATHSSKHHKSESSSGARKAQKNQ